VILGAAIVTLAFLGAVSVARAASLPVVAATMSTATVTNPCSGTATATPMDPVGNSGKYRDVIVALPAGCAGEVAVTLLEGSIVRASATQVLAAGGSLLLDNVVSGGFTPGTLTAAATLDGWHLPVGWA